VPIVAPEYHKFQPIKSLKPEDQPTKLANKTQGFAPGADITVKHQAATGMQIRNIERVLDVGMKMAVGEKLLIAAVITITQESQAYNLKGGDADSVGLFQQRASQGWHGLTNIEKAAEEFYNAAKKVLNIDKKQPWEIAADVQRPRFDLRKAYDLWTSEAERTVGAYGGESQPTDIIRAKRYYFSTRDDQGKKQNYWDALGRLMEEVGFSRFMANGKLYLIAEEDLLKGKPSMRFGRRDAGIINVSYDFTITKVVMNATITARMDRWVASPGEVIELVKCGRASGRWLIASVRRSLFDKEGTIELKKAQPEYKEPAPEVITTSIDEFRGPGGLRLGTADVARCYRFAQAIHNKHYPYVYGGGHARCGTPDGGDGSDSGIGYDCSGSTAAVLLGTDRSA
jgi:hypothetical protein